jgi:hypothetical protein
MGVMSKNNCMQLIIEMVVTRIFAMSGNIANASEIFSIDSPLRNVSIPSTNTFFGTITNNGANLLSSQDIFFNFFTLSTTPLTFEQSLGDVNFTIQPGATVSSVELFTARLGPFADQNQVYTADIQVQDSNNSIGNLLTIELRTVSGSGTVPEPGTLALAITALFFVYIFNKNRKA